MSNVLTKEALQAKPQERKTETFSLHGFGGEVVVGAILDANAYGKITEEVAILAQLRALPGTPSSGLSDETMFNCGVIAAGLVEPSLTVREVVDLVPVLGVNFHMMVARILWMSGMSEEAIKEREAALEANSFPAGSDGDSDRISAPASGRSGPDDPAVARPDGLCEDQGEEAGGGIE